jgi:hypothetical protein
MTKPNRFDGGALGGSIVVNVMAPRKVGKIHYLSGFQNYLSPVPAVISLIRNGKRNPRIFAMPA